MHPGVPTTGARMSRREHLLLVGLVLVGGGLGTSARAALEHALAAPTGWPWVTFTINVVGSFALGLLLGALAGRGADEGWRRAVRLGCGTGALGGFTTYSTFVLEVHRLADDRHLWGLSPFHYVPAYYEAVWRQLEELGVRAGAAV